MPLRDRAAQFAPFAALSGYEEAVAETERKHISAETASPVQPGTLPPDQD